MNPTTFAVEETAELSNCLDFPRVLRFQRISIALRHTVILTPLPLSVVGIVWLAPWLGVLSAMCAVSNATEETDPGIEEVAGRVAAITIRVSTVVGCVGDALGGAEGCV